MSLFSQSLGPLYNRPWSQLSRPRRDDVDRIGFTSETWDARPRNEIIWRDVPAFDELSLAQYEAIFRLQFSNPNLDHGVESTWNPLKKPTAPQKLGVALRLEPMPHATHATCNLSCMQYPTTCNPCHMQPMPHATYPACNIPVIHPACCPIPHAAQPACNPSHTRSPPCLAQSWWDIANRRSQRDSAHLNQIGASSLSQMTVTTQRSKSNERCTTQVVRDLSVVGILSGGFIKTGSE
jgi:hypothetical protein